MTITIELAPDKREQLAREAERMGTNVEELLARIAEEYLARSAAVDSAATYLLQKNAELYRRLAQ